MLRNLASGLLALVVAAGLAVASGSPVVAAPAVSGGDPAGDWEPITVSLEIVDPSLLASVDMKHLTVTRTPTGAWFGLRLKKVLPPGKVFQKFDVTVTAPASAPTPWRFGFNIVLQAPGNSGAGFQRDYRVLESVDCEIGFASTSRTVRVFVPEKCLPPGPGWLQSTVLLATTRNFKLLAEDRLEIRGADVS